MKVNDFELVRQAKNGDQKAFEELVTRHRTMMFQIIFRMVRVREEADDLVQEAFIKAFHSIHSFNEEYSFSTWLYKIGTNNCIDYLRKKKLQTYSIDKNVETKDGELKHELPDRDETPEGVLIHTERSKLIQQAVDSLPEKYRRAIILRHVEEKSYEEIAKMMKLPIGTVKARIFRAREMLNKALRKKIRG